MEKYSYFFYAQTDESKVVNGQRLYRMVQATGFFIRRNNGLFFVSAAHSLFPLQHAGQAPLSYTYPKTFKLRLFEAGSGNPKFFELDVSCKMPPPDFFTHHPDVFCLKMDIPAGYRQIYSVEDLLVEHPDLLKGATSAAMYGYPEKAPFSYNPEASKSTFDLSRYSDKFTFTERLNENLIGLRLNSGQLSAGVSGAPLFLNLSNGDVAFGGMCFGTSGGLVAFIRPQDILAEIPSH